MGTPTPNPKLIRKDILYPDLSYKITGLCLQVKKELGRFAKKKFLRSFRTEIQRK